MKRGAFILLVVLGLMLSAVADPTPCFYISPNGNDAWSGKLPEVNADNTDGPFATFPRAQQAEQQVLHNNLDRGVRIYVRGGTYKLKEALLFTELDAGRKQRPTQWMAYGEENPILEYQGKGFLVNFINTRSILFQGFTLVNGNVGGAWIYQSKNIKFYKNTLHDIDGIGVSIEECDDIAIGGNDFYDITQSAIKVAGSIHLQPFDGIGLFNNQIYRCATAEEKISNAIDIEENFCLILRNRIFSILTTAIFIVGQGNQIIDNEIFDAEAAVGLMSYIDGEATLIRSNHFHDMRITAIVNYEDGGDSVVEKNLFNTKQGDAIRFFENDDHHDVTKNIFVNSFPIFLNRPANKKSFTLSMKNNIIAAFPHQSDTRSLLYSFKSIDLTGCSFEANYFALPAENLYVKWASPKMRATQHVSMTAWQDMGFDQDSYSIPSPFIAPDLGDFGLRPDAFIVVENKFTPFRTYRFGLYEDEFRASWPPVESDAP